MNSLIQTYTLENGIHCKKITVETAIRRGIPGFQIGGASGNQREIAERVKTALQSIMIDCPYKSIIVNLAPSGIKKIGSHYDLAIAVSLLFHISDVIKKSFINTLDLNCTIFIGELSLMGDLIPVQSIHTFIQNAINDGIQNIILPEKNMEDIVNSLPLNIFPIGNLKEILNTSLKRESGKIFLKVEKTASSEFDSYKFPYHVLRAMMIAAAGWHSILFIGPPGTGKSTAARLLSYLMPEPNSKELLEIFNISHSNSKIKKSYTVQRPIRIPHHTATAKSMVGGGYPVEHGEVTRAHNGILILDEMAEFSRSTLQCLREPMQEKNVFIARGSESIKFPANFLFSATSNPCSCGYLGSNIRACICKPSSIESYRKKLMGPLRDRIELEVIVDGGKENNSTLRYSDIKALIGKAIQAQNRRFKNYRYNFNSEIEENDLAHLCSLEDVEGAEMLFNSTRFSHRVISGITRIARTIADLSGNEKIKSENLMEALSFRILDEYWPESSSHFIKK